MKFFANQYMVGIQEILVAVTNNNIIIVVVCCWLSIENVETGNI